LQAAFLLLSQIHHHAPHTNNNPSNFHATNLGHTTAANMRPKESSTPVSARWVSKNYHSLPTRRVLACWSILFHLSALHVAIFSGDFKIGNLWEVKRWMFMPSRLFNFPVDRRALDGLDGDLGGTTEVCCNAQFDLVSIILLFCLYFQLTLIYSSLSSNPYSSYMLYST